MHPIKLSYSVEEEQQESTELSALQGNCAAQEAQAGSRSWSPQAVSRRALRSPHPLHGMGCQLTAFPEIRKWRP